jgi:hypothetical protein
MTQTRIILIICAPRTGSSVLGEYLERYVHLRNINELFWLGIDKFGIGTPAGRKLTQQEQAHITGSANSNAHQLEYAIRQNPIQAIDRLVELNEKTLIIKILFHQIHGLPIHELVKREDTEIIILRRRDDLARFVSHKKCQITGSYHENDTSDIKIYVDRIEFGNDIKYVKKMYQAIEQLCKHYQKPVLELEYETHIENFDTETFYGLLDAWLTKLGLPAIKHGAKAMRFFKQNRNSMESSVENYSELVHCESTNNK